VTCAGLRANDLEVRRLQLAFICLPVSRMVTPHPALRATLSPKGARVMTQDFTYPHVAVLASHSPQIVVLFAVLLT